VSEVALYARVSSEKQAEHKTIDSQIRSVREFCEREKHNLNEEYIFVDNGYSGATLSRPGLDKLRDRALNGLLDKVVVLCPDRLARKQVHQLILMEELERLGVEIVFVNRQITNSAEDQLLLQIQGVVAEYEREKILERSRRGKLHKAKNGKVSVLGNAPYGYKYIPTNNGSDAAYEIDFKEATVVRKIYALCADEAVSTKKIAELLTQEQIPTRRGAERWDASTVYAILKNPAYMGKAAYGRRQSIPRSSITKKTREGSGYPKHTNSSCSLRPKEEWITIRVPAIIKEALFCQAEARLKDNQILSVRNTKHPYLLKGLLYCKECGYSLGGRTWSTNPKNHHRYKCLGSDYHRFGDKSCSATAIRGEDIEEIVWTETKRLLQEPNVILGEYYRRNTTESPKAFEKLMRQKKKEIARQQSQKERLISLCQTGDLSIKEVQKNLKAISLNLQELDSECEALLRDRETETKGITLVEQLQDFKERLSANLDNLTFDQKRAVLRLLVKEIVVDSKTNSVTINHVIPAQNCRLRLNRRNSIVQISNPLVIDPGVGVQAGSDC
jgi:site-specific DNA recombinase